MLDFHHQIPGKLRRYPLLVELVGFFLLDAVVSRNVKALAVVQLEVGIGRFGAKVVYAVDKMIVKQHQGIAHFRVLIESLRHQHDRREIHGPSPEIA